jgi:hypothetical protein
LFFIIASLSLFAASPATPGFLVGDDVWKSCLSSFSIDVGRCEGYISGVHDTVRAYEAWNRIAEICSPATATHRELRNIVVDYINMHPDYRRAQAASVVVLALRERFPCSTSRDKVSLK